MFLLLLAMFYHKTENPMQWVLGESRRPDLLLCFSNSSPARERWEKLCHFPPLFLFPHQPGPSLAARADDTTFELFVQHSEDKRGLQNEGEGMASSPPGLDADG